jgi:general secretion pathway protein D
MRMLILPPSRVAQAALVLLCAVPLLAQAPPYIKPIEEPPPQQQPQAAPPKPNPQVTVGTTPATAPQAQPRLAQDQPFSVGGVSLMEMIQALGKELKINFIVDPRIKGNVTIYTYGEVKPVDLMPLMETILRVNQAAMVRVGDFYRIVPIAAVSNLPIDPITNADPKTLPDDERMILNLIFLKYATAAEMAKLLTPFLGEGAAMTPYEPANLLIVQDNSRNMRRTVELISMFDADTFAGQRVQLFEVSNSRPSDIVKELDSVFKAYALSEKASAVRFIPVDRINTLIAVAPNPGIFAEVRTWIDKLDVPVKIMAGAVNNYVYRLRYGRAETIAMAIMALYSGNTFALAQMAMMMQQGNGMYNGGMGMGGMGMYPGGYGNGYASGMGGYPGYGAGGYGGYPGYGAMPGGGMTNNYQGGIPPISTPLGNLGNNANPQPITNAQDLTGSALGMAGIGQPYGQRMPHVIPNPFDNTLLVQGTPTEWEQISDLLRKLDVPPRQVLIDAKIYELQLTGAFSAGVQAYLEKRGTNSVATGTLLNVASIGTGVALSTGALLWRSHELLATLTAAETTHQAKIISAPSIIATDSIPATMNVGEDVPVLTSQAVVSGVNQNGSSPFANTISNRSTGVTLSITARVNSSGVVTMIVDQDVSAPQGNSVSNIDSPSFSRRSFQTQVTVQDGDTVAVGGFIGEEKDETSSGIPLLHRIPILGAAFGSKSISRTRTELIIFLTPRVIYDTNQIRDATDEIKSNLKKLQKMYKEP